MRWESQLGTSGAVVGRIEAVGDVVNRTASEYRRDQQRGQRWWHGEERGFTEKMATSTVKELLKDATVRGNYKLEEFAN